MPLMLDLVNLKVAITVRIRAILGTIFLPVPLERKFSGRGGTTYSPRAEPLSRAPVPPVAGRLVVCRKPRLPATDAGAASDASANG